jgi:hypothetical protein
LLPALDTLLFFLDNPGRVLTGAGAIETVPKYSYRFTAAVTRAGKCV